VRRYAGLSDPWNWALALPAILTTCVIAYGCHSWFSISAGILVAPPALTSQTATPPRPAEAVITTASPKASETNHPPSINSAAPERTIPAVSVLVADPVAAADVLGPDDVLMMTGSVQREEAVGTMQPTSSPRRDVGVVEYAREVQRRLAELGYFSGTASGSWGGSSRGALRAFKVANQLPANDVWDPLTEESLFRAEAQPTEAYVGVWATEPGACSSRRQAEASLPTVVESNRARAGDTSCVFQRKRRVGSDWAMVAKCTTPGENWTAHVRLIVANNRLTWESERGSQEYLRCGPRTNVATR
jgi:hypothetical protein